MTTQTLTDRIAALEGGDIEARKRVFAFLYDELRGVAHHMRGRWGEAPTLETTGLVHEVYVKLASAGELDVSSRRHFLRLAARAMRQLLSNHARDRRRLKRGGDLRRTGADVDALPGHLPLDDLETIIALDEALETLESVNERAARVVECRFFAGLSIPETAEALDVAPATVKRDWAYARDWLFRRLMGDETT